jgi:hypothetical protein
MEDGSTLTLVDHDSAAKCITVDLEGPCAAVARHQESLFMERAAERQFSSRNRIWSVAERKQNASKPRLGIASPLTTHLTNAVPLAQNMQDYRIYLSPHLAANSAQAGERN